MATVRSETKRRATAWAVGTVLILGGFWLRRGLRRTSNSSGTEIRLFSIGIEHVRLYESPNGGDWLASVAPNSTTLTGLRQAVSTISWASWSLREMRPLNSLGSYVLAGSGLRRVWAVQADGWLDTSHFFGLKDGAAQLGRPSTLDLRTHRVRWLSPDFDPDPADLPGDLPRAKPSLHHLPSDSTDGAVDENDDFGQRGPDTPDLEIPGADGWPGDGDGARYWGRVGERKIILARQQPGDGDRPGLYALSDDDAPRSLRLAGEGTPLAISRDGRTLFFEREHALWRLDLRKPLPQLLDDVRVAALPDPPEEK